MSECQGQVSHDGWHFYKCGKPVKAAFCNKENDKRVIVLCGIHAKSYRKNTYFWEEISLDKVVQS
jgi:hypothetical protein